MTTPPRSPKEDPLFASEQTFSNWLLNRRAASDALPLTPTELDDVCASHREILDTLVRVTRVSDLAQRQTTRSHGQLRRQLDASRDSNRRLTSRHSEQDDILALAAHDLRSPLATICGLSDAIKSLLPDDTDPNILDYVYETRRIADDLLDLVSNLLDNYRITQGQIVPHPAPTDIPTLVRILSTHWQSAAILKKIDLRFSEPEKSTTFALDVALFRHVADNLISNAIKYSPPSAPVDITLTHGDDVLQMTVVDSGAGISPKDQARLFQRFPAISNAPTHGEPSTGIGLALARRILQLLGGTITYRLLKPHGSSFQIHIPTSPIRSSSPGEAPFRRNSL